MVKVHDKHTVPGFSPDDVFEAGIRTKNIPRDLDHLTITPQKNQRKLRPDSTLAVVFSCQDSPLQRFQEDDVEIEVAVTAFKPAELVVIEGESDEVAARLTIELSRAARNGTRVSHELEIELLEARRSKRILFEAIGAKLFQGDITMFRTAHLASTLEDLDKKKPAPVAPIRKPFIEQPDFDKVASSI
ncbi:MAG: hypothetical protein Q7T74_00805 [Candidatus Saccharibacteria bacterium]|nr:hypothetical protein [Candidatus Saccharibacteria bacterium]